MNVIALPPSGALRFPAGQVIRAFAGAAMVIPAGRTSTKAISSAEVVSVLPMSNRSVLTLPGPMVLGVKLFAKDETTTVPKFGEAVVVASLIVGVSPQADAYTATKATAISLRTIKPSKGT